MASGTITSAGIGSNIDIESLITNLMQIERKPITQLQTQNTTQQAKLSAFGTLKSNLSKLQTAAEAIDTRNEFAAFKANLADTAVASATAGAGAAASSYRLEVTSLASSQKVVTAAQGSGYTFADGTLSLTVGTTTTNVNISAAAGNNTLSGVRDAINAANGGVTASLLNDGSGTRLVLTAKNSGTANAVTISGLGLDFNPNNVAASGALVDQSTSKVATNAVFKIDDVEITRSSNTVSDALDGVTLNLSKTNTGNPTTLTITQDNSAMEEKVKAFITAYNNVISNIKTQTAYNTETKVAGTLNGDSAVRSIQTQLRNVLSGTLAGGSLTRLSEVGMSIAVDGTLSLDSTKFQAALNNPTKDVSALFGSSGSIDGFAKQIATKVSDFLDSDGLLTSRTDGINKSISNIAKQIETLNVRLESIEDRYRRQFTALDTTVASWTNTGNYLTQQLSTLLSSYS